jgi:WD40 repeat protein
MIKVLSEYLKTPVTTFRILQFLASAAYLLDQQHPYRMRTWNEWYSHVCAVFRKELKMSGLKTLGLSLVMVLGVWCFPLFATPELKVATGHAGRVTSVALAPNGQLALTAAYDDTIKLWDIKSGREIRTFKTDRGGIGSTAFSPDGHLALTAGYKDNSIKVWDTKTWLPLRSFRGHTTGIVSLAFSPDSKTVFATYYDNTFRIIDCNSGRELASFSGGGGNIQVAACSPDGRLAAYAGSSQRDGKIQLRDITAGTVLQDLVGHSKDIISLKFSADGHRLLSSSYDGKIKTWDVATGKELISIDATYNSSVVFTPDAQAIITYDSFQNKPMRLWNARTGKEILSFDASSIGVSAIAVSADGRSVLTGLANGRLCFFSTASGKELRRFGDSLDGFRSGFYSPDGHFLSAVSGMNLVTWNAATGRKIRDQAGSTDQTVYSLNFSPDRRLALVGCEDGTLSLLDVTSWKLLLRIKAHAQGVTASAFSPDGRYLLSAGYDEKIRLWDFRTGTEIRTFDGDCFGGPRSLGFSADGTRVFSINGQDDLAIWDVATGKCLLEYWDVGSCTSACFTPDGSGTIGFFYKGDTARFLAVLDIAQEKITRRTDINPSREYAYFIHLIAWQGRILMAVPSPDGLTLTDAMTMKSLTTFSSAKGAFDSLADISPDGKKALVIAADNTIRQYDLASGIELEASIYDHGEWLNWTPDGFFDGSNAAMHDKV